MAKSFFLFLLVCTLSICFQHPANAAGSAPLHGLVVSGGRYLHARPCKPHSIRASVAHGASETPQGYTWDAVISGAQNSVDGAQITCFASDSEYLYVGGDFQSFDSVQNANFIVRYDRKSGAWSGVGGGFDNVVYAIALHNGRLYAAGSFSYAGYGLNTRVDHLAVWNGSAWEPVGGGTDGAVNALAFMGDSLFVGGDFTNAGSNPAYHLALWDGFSWSEVEGGTSYPVTTLLVTGDSLFVGGNFSTVGNENNPGGIQAGGVALLRNNTWHSFASGFDGEVRTLALWHGKLWAGGDFFWDWHGQTPYFGLAAWDSSEWHSFGQDTGVGTSSSGPIDELLPMGDSLLAIGEFNSIAGVSASGIAAFTNGTWFQPAGGLYGYASAATLFDGKLWVGGTYTKAGTDSVCYLATLSNNTWGSIGQGPYNGWQSDVVDAIATTPRYVFIGGSFSRIAGKPANHLAVWDKQARSWSAVGQGVDGNVYSLAIQGDHLFAGGSFNDAGSITAKHIAEYTIGTGNWNAMGNGAVRDIQCIAADNSNVYAAITFNVQSSQWNNYLGDWNGTSWQPAGGPFTGFAHALALQGQNLFLGGYLLTADGGAVNNIAELTNGSWSALNGGLDDQVWSLAVVDTDLYAGGDFVTADGILSPGIARWDGQEWDSVGGGVLGSVYALTRANGGVYLGGSFFPYGNFQTGDLALWNGTSLTTVDGGVNDQVNALATDTADLYVGGWFTGVGINQTPSSHFAALHGAGAGVEFSAATGGTISIYPNPTSASSTISFDLAKPADVRIELFNAIGSRIGLLANSYYNTGHFDVPLDVSNLAPGMYFLRLTSGGVVSSRSFVTESR